MRLLVFFLSLACSLAAAPTVTCDGQSCAAITIIGASTATVTGPLVYGRLGDIPESSWVGAVVLLDRGTISFFDKVKKVRDFGGIAVVVANNVPGLNSGTLQTGNTSSIPAVTISQADGEAMRGKVGVTATVGTAPLPGPAMPLPDPVGHTGEMLSSDGVKYVWVKALVVYPQLPFTSMADLGMPISFNVSAQGSPPFLYQWIKDGVNIEGQTSAVFSLASAKASDAGVYICQVANPFGTTPSGPCTLIVK